MGNHWGNEKKGFPVSIPAGHDYYVTLWPDTEGVVAELRNEDRVVCDLDHLYWCQELVRPPTWYERRIRHLTFEDKVKHQVDAFKARADDLAARSKCKMTRREYMESWLNSVKNRL